MRIEPPARIPTVAKGQIRADKQPKKADVDARKAKKAAGPSYLRSAKIKTPGDLRTPKPGKKS